MKPKPSKKKISKARTLRSLRKKQKMKLKKTYKRVGGSGSGGRKRGREEDREEDTRSWWNFLWRRRRRLQEQAQAEEEETKEETMHQEEKSAAEPDEYEREELNNVSDFLLHSIRPEIRDHILKYSDIEIYYKLKEIHLPKLIKEVKRLNKRIQELDENFSENYPEGTMYDLQENYNKRVALLKIIKKYIEILDKKGIYKHNSNL
tara:strand:+ start:761 stop:1375 length:615 start_codon:yes stop_codon:yes gene_type:complete